MHIKTFEEYHNSGNLDTEFQEIDVLLQRVMHENFTEEEYIEFLFELVDHDGDIETIDTELIREHVRQGSGRVMILNETTEKENTNIIQGCGALSSQNKCVEYMVESAGKPKAKAEKIGTKMTKFSGKAEEGITKINGVFGKIVKYVGKKMGLKENLELNEFEMSSYPIMNQKTSFLALCLFAVLNFGFLFSPLLAGLAIGGGIIGIIGIVLTAIILLFRRAKIRSSLHHVVHDVVGGESSAPPEFHRTLGRMSNYGGSNTANKPRKSTIGSGSTTGVLQKKQPTISHTSRKR